MNTAQKIAVMQAFEAGKSIQFRNRVAGSPWQPASSPRWNWFQREYRVAPPKPVRVNKFVVIDCDGDLCNLRFDDRASAESKCVERNRNGSYAPYVVGMLTYETQA